MFVSAPLAQIGVITRSTPQPVVIHLAPRNSLEQWRAQKNLAPTGRIRWGWHFLHAGGRRSAAISVVTVTARACEDAENFGGEKGTRTTNPLLGKEVLNHLSLAGACRIFLFASALRSSITEMVLWINSRNSPAERDESRFEQTMSHQVTSPRCIHRHMSGYMSI